MHRLLVTMLFVLLLVCPFAYAQEQGSPVQMAHEAKVEGEVIFFTRGGERKNKFLDHEEGFINFPLWGKVETGIWSEKEPDGLLRVGPGVGVKFTKGCHDLALINYFLFESKSMFRDGDRFAAPALFYNVRLPKEVELKFTGSARFNLSREGELESVNLDRAEVVVPVKKSISGFVSLKTVNFRTNTPVHSSKEPIWKNHTDAWLGVEFPFPAQKLVKFKAGYWVPFNDRHGRGGGPAIGVTFISPH